MDSTTICLLANFRKAFAVIISDFPRFVFHLVVGDLRSPFSAAACLQHGKCDHGLPLLPRPHPTPRPPGPCPGAGMGGVGKGATDANRIGNVKIIFFYVFIIPIFNLILLLKFFSSKLRVLLKFPPSRFLSKFRFLPFSRSAPVARRTADPYEFLHQATQVQRTGGVSAAYKFRCGKIIYKNSLCVVLDCPQQTNINSSDEGSRYSSTKTTSSHYFTHLTLLIYQFFFLSG